MISRSTGLDTGGRLRDWWHKIISVLFLQVLLGSGVAWGYGEPTGKTLEKQESQRDMFLGVGKLGPKGGTGNDVADRAYRNFTQSGQATQPTGGQEVADPRKPGDGGDPVGGPANPDPSAPPPGTAAAGPAPPPSATDSNGVPMNGNPSGLAGGEIDSRPMGYSTLGEYMQSIPSLLKEMQAADSHVRSFRDTARKIAREKRQQAAELRRMAEDMRARAGNLDEIPLEDGAGGSSARSLAAAPGGGGAPDSRQEASYPRTAGGLSPTIAGGQVSRVSLPEEQAIRGPASVAKPELTEKEALEAFNGELNMRGPGTGSTIAVEEKGAPASSQAVAEKSKPVKTGMKENAASLREKLRRALASEAARAGSAGPEERGTESGAQSALRDAIQLAEQTTPSSPVGLDADPLGRFTLAGADTDAAVRKLVEPLGRQAGVLEAESETLFVRVHAAHRRSQRGWARERVAGIAPQ